MTGESPNPAPTTAEMLQKAFQDAVICSDYSVADNLYYWSFEGDTSIDAEKFAATVEEHFRKLYTPKGGIAGLQCGDGTSTWYFPQDGQPDSHAPGSEGSE